MNGYGIMIAEMLSFPIDRNSWIKLPHQVADGLRQEIAAGIWRVGDKMASSRQICEVLGVSLRTAEEALRILDKEGWVSLRAKSRAVVNAEKTVQRNHCVLLVQPGGIRQYMFAVFYEKLRTRLTDAGYMVSLATLPRVGIRQRYDITRLQVELRRAYELVVCHDSKPHVFNIIKESGWPFVIVRTKRKTSVANCAGLVPYSTQTAVASFVRHCKRRKIGQILAVQKWHGDGQEVLTALSAAGIHIKSWVIPAPVCELRGECVEKAAFAAFSRKLEKSGRNWLPEVLYFTDDHTCYGAMTAMLTYGVRVPEDVRVATIATVGIRRTFKTSFTSFEHDPGKMGEMTADCLLEYLRTGIFPVAPELSPSFRIGGSFP